MILRVLYAITLSLVVLASARAADECTPTTTYATWNASDKSARVTLSNGNLTAQVVDGASTAGGVRATYGKTTGKWYWEITVQANDDAIGVANDSYSLAGYIHHSTNGWAYHTNGQKYHNQISSGTSYGASYAAGAVIGIAVDLDAGKIWFSKNGTWQGSGDPSAGTNAAFTNLTGTIYAAWSNADFGGSYNDPAATANFGATSFTYTPPTGFNAGWYEAEECEEPPPEEGGPENFLCVEVSENECTEFAPYVETLATFDDLGIDGEVLTEAFSWGAGIVLLFFMIGIGFGLIHRTLETTLGGRHDG